MASTIQLKTGTGSAVPSSLTQGEVAINVDNGLIYYGSGSVNSVKQLESFTNITASGGISASGTINAQAMGIDADQFYRAGGVAALNYDSTTGGGRIEVGSANKPLALMNNVTASGDISASGTLKGNSLDILNTTFNGNTFTTTGDFVLDTNTDIILDAAGGNIEFKDAGTLQLTLDMDGTAGAQVITHGVAGDDILFKNQGGSSVLTLKSEGQTEIHGKVTASGTISASAFVGTPVIIHEWAGYLGSFTPDRYYYGHTLYGPTHHLWNGNVLSEPSNMNDLGSARHGLYFHYVPFNLTNIGIRGGAQSNNTGTDTIQFHLYKTTPANSISADNSVLTKIGVAETDNIDNANQNFTANLTTTGSCNAGDALVLLVRPTGTSAAIRWNYTIFGYSNG